MKDIFFLLVVILILFLLDAYLNRKNNDKKDFDNNINKYANVNDKLESKKENEELTEKIRQYSRERTAKRVAKSEEFCKIYGISNISLLHYDYYESIGVISSTNIEVTPHEFTVAKDIINKRYFDRRCVFLDNYFKSKNGRFVQVDIIAVNRKGVFIFESKDYNGWIFGNGKQQMWTETFYKDKFRFYNPIRQNYGHIQCIKEWLSKKGVKFYSIVVFGGGAKLKNISYIPQSTFIVTTHRLTEMLSDIMKKEPDSLSASEIIEVCREINAHKVEPTNEIRHEHVEKIKEKTGSNRIYD